MEGRGKSCGCPAERPGNKRSRPQTVLLEPTGWPERGGNERTRLGLRPVERAKLLECAAQWGMQDESTWDRFHSPQVRDGVGPRGVMAKMETLGGRLEEVVCVGEGHVLPHRASGAAYQPMSDSTAGGCQGEPAYQSPQRRGARGVSVPECYLCTRRRSGRRSRKRPKNGHEHSKRSAGRFGRRAMPTQRLPQ